MTDDRFRPDAALLPLLPPEEHPVGCDCERCFWTVKGYASGGFVKGPAPRLDLGGCCGFPRR